MFGRKAERSETESERRCSFCNKSQNDVRKLIAGPTVFICDECVQVCVKILVDDPRAKALQRDVGAAASSGKPWPASDAWCAFCGEVADLGTALLIENRTLLCSSCVQGISTAAKQAEPRE